MKLVKRILNHKLFSYHIDGYMSRSGNGCVESYNRPRDVDVTVGTVLRYVLVAILVFFEALLCWGLISVLMSVANGTLQ